MPRRVSRFVHKPPAGKLVLDRSHPVTKNMVACYIFNTTKSPANLAKPTDGAHIITGTPTLTGDTRGGQRFSPSIDFDGSSMIEIPVTNRWGIDFNGGNFSCYALIDADANGYVLGMFNAFGIGYDQGQTWYNFAIMGNTWEGGWGAWAGLAGDAPSNAFQVFYQFNGNNVQRVAWIDNTRNTTTTFRAHSTSSGNSLYVGGSPAGTASHNGRIYALYLWDKSVPEEYYTQYLRRNPYCFLKAFNNRIYSPPAATSATTATISRLCLMGVS